MNVSMILYLTMALSTAIANFLGTVDAAQWIDPQMLFWAKGVNGIIAGAAITMKGYTSQGFQDWLNKKQIEKVSP